MATPQPQRPRWYPAPLRAYRERIELFRWEWNMANKGDYGDDCPEITWDEAHQIWLELYGGEQAAG